MSQSNLEKQLIDVPKIEYLYTEERRRQMAAELGSKATTALEIYQLDRDNPIHDHNIPEVHQDTV